MSGNNIQHSITVGGTGNITLGAVSGADRHTLLDAYGAGHHFHGSIKEGDDSEFGVYRIVTASPLVLERVNVIETIVSGTYDNTSPTAINVTTAGTFQMVADANAIVDAPNGLPYASGGIVGRPSIHDHDVDGTNVGIGVFRYMVPFIRISNKPITSLSFVCAVSPGASEVKAFAYQKQYANGSPGILYGEFTSGSTIDTSTTGIKTATPASPIHVPDTEFFICIQASVTGVSLNGSAQTSGGFLGTESDGSVIGSLWRDVPYASVGEDETASTWSKTRNKHTIWLNW